MTICVFVSLHAAPLRLHWVDKHVYHVVMLVLLADQSLAG